ncbi:trigger factor [Azorhizobium oxalatiphilum]|uniref:Trigger factor n=1 Tax=Azorhizobium oxalatiphilum TaxID=980631 RepID=A0A917BTF5_9HYPH|nr:trigger factor [Azorhizobium oxalatiphilum]GGF56171.1 trigger factor [Azorhizobium oxalatiphilum]
MQVTETQAEGLKRAYTVVLPAADLDAKAQDRLVELKDKVKINGFRPGKVPVAHLKALYGKSVMAEVIEQAVTEANGKIVEDNKLRLALPPKVALPEAEDEVKSVIEGAADLKYTVELEVLPAIELGNFKDIAIEKPVAIVSDEEVDETIKRISDANRPFSAKEGAAASGDRITVDFVGSIDGVPFDGGAGQDIPVVIGSNSFIPGFEEQLIGLSAGEERTITVTFPTNYLSAELAGKEASFAVTAKGIEAPGDLAIDDEFAKTLGLESLDKLKENVRERISKEHEGATRQRVKRQLLDALDAGHKFDVPPTLVEQEFEGVWNQVQQDLTQQNRTFADEGTTEEDARAEYQKIAERRVRLGLVLAEIGERNNIQVSDDEVTRAVVERARQFPGQEQQVWDYYRRNAQAMASLRAPLFEEKVVDFLLELANVTEKQVSREELYKEDEEKAA